MNRLLMWKKSKSDIIRTCGKNSVLTLKKPTNRHSMELYTLSVLIFAVQNFRGGRNFAVFNFAVKKSRFSRGLNFAVSYVFFIEKIRKKSTNNG